MFSLVTVFQYMLCLVTQSCLSLCDPMDCSPPGSSVHGTSQARILEWVAMPSSRESSQPRDWTQVSCIAGGFFYHLNHQGSPKQRWFVVKRMEYWEQSHCMNQACIGILWILPPESLCGHWSEAFWVWHLTSGMPVYQRLVLCSWWVPVHYDPASQMVTAQLPNSTWPLRIGVLKPVKQPIPCS